MSYATIAQFRAKPYVEQVGTGVTVDAAIQAVLDRAHAIINEALGFSFAAYGETASDKDVRGDGGEWLWVPAYEGGSITGITAVSGRAETGESETAITDYVVDEDERPYRVWRGSGWTRGTWYRVTANWGYGAAPASIVEVELEVATNIWRSAAGTSFGTSVGMEGGGAVAVNRALTWAQRSIIDGVRSSYLGVVVA